jgi:hypothetical protein
MAVGTAVPVQPSTPEPALVDQVTLFVQNYWGFILFILGLGVAVLFFYFWRRDRKEDSKTKYHLLHDKFEELCKKQADRGRLRPNPSLAVGLIGLSAVTSWFLCLFIFKETGMIVGLFLGFTVLILGGVINYFLNPFVQRDMVFIRFKQGEVIREKFIGYYAGEYVSSDSYLNLLLYRGRKKIIFRDKVVLRIPQSIDAFYDLEHLEKQYGDDEEGYEKAMKEIIDKYSKFIPEIVQFNDRTIVINHTKSLDRFRHFYYPVFVDELGHVVSKGVRYFKSIKEQAALEQLYDMTEESSKAQIRAIQINPRVQYKQATGEDAIDDVETDDEK